MECQLQKGRDFVLLLLCSQDLVQCPPYRGTGEAQLVYVEWLAGEQVCGFSLFFNSRVTHDFLIAAF